MTFGLFTLDPASGALSRDGAPVPLTPKALEVLDYLARRPGRLVTKRELLQSIWAGTFVTDGALKVCIRQIRKALDDDARQPTYVETAHRRGYRFIASVATRGAQPPQAGAFVGDPAALAGPAVRYAHSGEVNIAYQVVGEGPIDLVFVMGWVSHLEYFWLEPGFARFLSRLASFTRLILLDKRGTGLSDRVSELPTLEQRMDDVRAVLQAVGSRRAVLMGVSEGGPLCSLFAATHPQNTAGLIMIGSYARRLRDADYPWGPTRAEHERFCEQILEEWGGPVGIEQRAPGAAHDPAFRAWWAAYLRMGASPGAAVALTRMNAAVDIRPVLGTIRVPTLVIHRTGDRCLKVEEGRYLASQIPDARFVELPGADHLPFVGDQDAVLDAVESFLRELGTRSPARVLATIVHVEADSAAAFEAADSDIAWFRGHVQDAGDRALIATFDGPARAVKAASRVVADATRAGHAVRAGVHTGECRFDPQGVAGPAVDMSRELAALAPDGRVLVSRTVTDLVAGSGLAFEAAGLGAEAEPGKQLFLVRV